jgi:hypothetical protein
MRYRLRTLLILLAILPPVLAAPWFVNPDYVLWFLLLAAPWLLGVGAVIALAILATVLLDRIQRWLQQNR